MRVRSWIVTSEAKFSINGARTASCRSVYTETGSGGADKVVESGKGELISYTDVECRTQQPAEEQELHSTQLRTAKQAIDTVKRRNLVEWK
jgi:hypothetical protein